MALARCVLAVILGALPTVAGVDPALHSLLRRPQTSSPRPQHASSLPSAWRPPRTPRFPLPPRVPAAQRPQVLTARHTPPRLPRGCGAGELWGNTTDLGVRCLHWAEVPPFLERSPPASWAELRGQPHNFCRSPDGVGKPWCFYRNAQGKVDWGYCDCSQGPVLPVIRLTGGNSGHEGRVELYHSGQWGTICDDQWDDADAEVICRQLGLSGIAKAWHRAHFGEGSGPILLDEVRCTGNELSIEQCSKSSWGEHNCGHKEDAGVSCVPLTDGVIRLAGGKSSHEGRLEVYYKGKWGTVCDDGWSEMNTYVACRLLGFKYGKQSSVSHFEGSNGPIWLDDISCSGKESSFIQCSRRQWGRHDCSHREDVGLTCYPDSDGHRLSPGFPIRLMDGENKKEGRVEVFVNGQWGTICDDGWTDKDAAVICRQLGYKGAARARAMAYFGEGKGPIHMDNVKCTGNEKSLADCVKQDIGRHNCRHSEDAGVICDYHEKTASSNSNKELFPSGCGLRLLHRRQKRIIGGNNSLRYGNNTRSYAVRVGDYHTLVPEEFEEEIGVQQIVIHRNYRPDSSDYDIALGFRAGRCTDGFLNLRAGRRGQREHERRADPPRMRASPAGCSPSSRSGHGREEIPPDTPPSAPLYPGLRRTRGSRGTPRDGPLVENVPRLRGSRESSPGPHMLRGAALSGAAMLSCGLRVGVTFASEGPGDAYKARSAQCLFLPHTSFMTRKNELANNRAFRT
ncbi:neurotrypsin [Cricetulus griseus]|nr:neurotrypsin [Cricetulus griseus]